MKKLIILLSILFITLTSCHYYDIRQNQKPIQFVEFETKQSYVLKENIVQLFSRRLNVWKIDYLSYQQEEWYNRKTSSLYKIREKLLLDNKEYIIKDNTQNGKEYLLKEIIASDRDKTKNAKYIISTQNKKIAEIKQLYPDNNFLFEIIYNNNKFTLTAENNNLNKESIVKDIIFSLKNQEKVYAYFTKKLLLMKNEYDITINKEDIIAEDVFFICIGTLIDQILREKDYDYKY